MRPATPDEIAGWDELVCLNPDGGNVLQCRAFGEAKSRYGWGTNYQILETPAGSIASLFLTRKLPGFGQLWYAPKGPGVSSLSQLEGLKSSVERLASSVFLIKVEPELQRSAVNADITALGLIKSARDIQLNSSTVVVDLKPTEEELLASFKQKTRYNIRLAERKEVKVEPVEITDNTINQMYALMQATYSRAGVYTRSKDYFKDFWRLHAAAQCGQLFFATFEGEVQAAAFITYLGHKALYKDGASSRGRSDLQAPYLLQWEVMRWLKNHGVTEYDLHGTPPAHQLEDVSHPLASLGRFKTGFNSVITEYIGTYDLPIDRGRYKAWLRYGERASETYNFRLKKRLFY